MILNDEKLYQNLGTDACGPFYFTVEIIAKMNVWEPHAAPESMLLSLTGQVLLPNSSKYHALCGRVSCFGCFRFSDPNCRMYVYVCVL